MAVVSDGDADSARSGGMDGMVGAQEESSALAHGVDGVGYEVAEDLADLALEAVEWGWSDGASMDGDVAVGEASLIEGDDGVEELGCGGGCGTGALTVEAQGLGCDLGAAEDFGLGDGEVFGDFEREFVVAFGEIDEVGDGLKGIVDLV